MVISSRDGKSWEVKNANVAVDRETFDRDGKIPTVDVDYKPTPKSHRK